MSISNFAGRLSEQEPPKFDLAHNIAGDASSPRLEVSERTQLLRDGVFNASAFIVSGAVGLMMVPILLYGLGAQMYGVWVYALSAGALVSLIDPGLGWSLSREVARAEVRSCDEYGKDSAGRLVNNIGIAYIIIASAGAGLISLLGLVLVPSLHLSFSNSEIAFLVFCLIGASFLGDTMNDFGVGVLHGLRRFDVASAIAISDTLVTNGGVLALVLAGRGLQYIAGWYALMSLVTALVTIGLTSHVAPRYRIRPVWPSWQTLLPQLEFGLKSQLASGMRGAGWRFMPLLVGIVAGPATVTIYDVGQKFPRFLRTTGGFLSQTIFPSASTYVDDNRREVKLEIVETGLREVFLITTPLFLIVGILAPSLLTIWLGTLSIETLWVLRLTLIAAWLDCMVGPLLHFMWGSGEVNEVLAVVSAGAVVNLILSILLIIELGAAGAALATVIVGGAVCVPLLRIGSSALGSGMPALLRRAWRGLSIPAAACAAIILSAVHLAGANRPTTFVLICAASVITYAIVLLARGMRKEEKTVFEEAIGVPSMQLIRRIYRGLRRVGFPWVDWQAALVEMIADSPRQKSVGLDRTFDHKEDPFGFLMPYGVARHSHMCEMLDAVRGARKFKRALEVGCAEGLFSQLLAPRCESILATDVSMVALQRARARCANLKQIEFALWNIRRDPMIAKFDLIVAMDVLYYLTRPWDLRRAARVLIDSLLQDGYLLIENDKEHYPYEQRWWADFIFHSARAIDSLFVHDPLLEVVSTEDNDRYICTVLRKI